MRGKAKSEFMYLEAVTEDTHQYLSIKSFKCDYS